MYLILPCALIEIQYRFIMSVTESGRDLFAAAVNKHLQALIARRRSCSGVLIGRAGFGYYRDRGPAVRAEIVRGSKPVSALSAEFVSYKPDRTAADPLSGGTVDMHHPVRSVNGK